MLTTAIGVALALAGAAAGDNRDSKSPEAGSVHWRYVVPASGDPFEHAPFRALVLSRDKPEELIEKIAYRGEPARRQYGRVRFGSPSSTRVTVVVDTLASGAVDLYTDADRNLKIDDRDRVALATDSAAGQGRARIWRLPLAVALVEDGTVHTVPRAVVFRLGASGQTLGYAVAGFLEGTVTLGGHETGTGSRGGVRSLVVRRVDGDGNGLLTDAQDRIWIDLNRDGHFDATSEQFLYTSVINLQGSRFVVLSDLVGSRLAFKPLLGTGTLRLAIGSRQAASAVNAVELHATAISRDGSVFAVTGNEPATVPAGEYRLGTVTLSLDDAKSSRRWSFVFSDGGGRGQPVWHKVEKDAAVTIDPIGTPTFELKLTAQTTTAKPGEEVALQPALYTSDGLLIVVAYCGNPIAPAVQEILGARITLVTAGGEALATAHSGFS